MEFRGDYEDFRGFPIKELVIIQFKESGEEMNQILENYEIFIMVFIIVFLFLYGGFCLLQKRKNKLEKIKPFQKKKVKKEAKRKNVNQMLTDKDKDLFQEFLLILPLKGGSIEFLKSHTMEKDFHSSELDDLYTFYYDSNRETNKFSQKEIEEERTKIYNLIGTYIVTISESLEDVGMGHMKASKNIELLNREALEIIEGYSNFIDDVEKFH